MLRRLNESSPIFSRFLVFILLPAAVAATATYVYLNKSLPVETGNIQVAGIAANVSIERGADAVPHIRAGSDEDAYFALGYVHAQDRMWQMEYQKLIGQGRLSEIRGASTLKTDFYVRTLGLRQAAEKALTQLAPRSRQLLDAYVKGVNARMNEHGTLPLEYFVNGRQPEPWTAADSMLQLKLLQIGFDDSSVETMRQLALVRQFDLAKANDLVRADLGQDVGVGEDFKEPGAELVRAIMTDAGRLKTEYGIGDGDPGSSAWAISGKLTASGMPILANDLHSLAQIPSKWYMAEIRGKDIHVAGASIPGLPIVFSGRNEKIAWGTTMLVARTRSLAEEKINPLDDNQYAGKGGWKPMEARTETVRVKSAFPSYLRGEIKPVRIVVRATERGPLISDLAESSGVAYSIALAGLSPQDKSFDSLLALNSASDWDTAKSALRDYVSPAMNIVYADQAGNIASKIVGKLAYGSVIPGFTLPAPAVAGAEQFVPFDALPEFVNPADGIIVRANSGGDAQPGAGDAESRTSRMERLLHDRAVAEGKVDIGNAQQVQGDDLSIGAPTALKQLLSVKAQNPNQEKALGYLRAWDFRAGPESVAASIYDAWADHLFEALIMENTSNPAASRRMLETYSEHAKLRFIDLVLSKRQNAWCPGKAGSNGCDALMARSLQAALDELQLSVGKNMERWQWGAIHKVAYRHPGIDSESIFAGFFIRRGPGEGDNFSISGNGPAVFSKDEGYQSFAGSSYRQLIDLGAENKSGFAINTGQSGNILSARYDNFVNRTTGSTLEKLGFGETLLGAKVLTLIKPSSKSE